MSETNEFDEAVTPYYGGGGDTNPDGAELRDKVKAWVKANSSSYKSVGLLSGIAESTFQAWITGKYRGNNNKINDKITLWLDSEQLLSRTKVTLPETEFTKTRSAAKILTALQYAQSMADIVVITGGAGVGKTTSCKQHRILHPNVWMLTAEPSLSSAYAMLEYLRETLNIPQTAPFKLSRAITAKIVGTQGLIIIDEAQHLEIKAVDQMRAIHDRSNIGLAFVGNEEVWNRMDGGGRKTEFAQIYSRVGKRVTIARPAPRDINELLDASDVQDEGSRKVLTHLAQKPGALRGMMKTLRQARLVALGAEEELNAGHVRAAWENLLGEKDAGL